MRYEGLRVRSAEDECEVLPHEHGPEHWDEDEAGDMEHAYRNAPPQLRAHALRAYISAGEYETARNARREYADMLASHAGFSRREIRSLIHLKDGQAPAGGWAE